MKKFITLIYVVFIILMVSCEKEPDINFGFDSPINTNSKGFVMAHFPGNVNNVYLSGYVSLSEGELEINMLNSNEFVVYSRTVIAPVELQICESFDANKGYWKLRYTSRSGIGEIDLHMHN